MATLDEAIGRSARRLADAGVDEPRAEARRLAALATGKAPEELLSARDDVLPEEADRRLEEIVARRAAHEPFAYIAGEREFWSLPFRVTPATLVPRPDTETVVEVALGYVREKRMTSPRILDLGTGTGCIALALLSELRDASALATDVSDDALGVAETNARALGLADRIAFRRVAWTDGIDENFDLIVSNPPYIRDGDAVSLAPDVVDYEPRTALFAGADGLDAYRSIAAGAPSHLKRNGALVLEVGAGQSDDVSRLLRGAGLDIKGVRSDLSGISRCVIATWPGN
jgi:release factor glutamine methyltransferase